MRGKVRSVRHSGILTQDHPRLCGEKPPFIIEVYHFLGSPPPMRGKDSNVVQLDSSVRITPAYAGKSSFKFPSVNTCGDHPRLCGEKTISRNFSRFSSGSPPPMRGKANLEFHRFFHSWITPAYAGKSPEIPFTRHVELGSPPPMRGKGQSSGGGGRRVGITPAYAGKSSFSARSISSQKDHPRLCGEKCRQSDVLNRPLGSPPPMRGKVEQREQMQISIRITPAYAGKSLLDSGDTRFAQDHPRLCGEKFTLSFTPLQ